MYIYNIFHPRYLHYDIFRYMTHEITQDISGCYFMAVISCCTEQAHYPCSYSNRLNLSIFLVFMATFLLCSQLNPVRAAAKMSAGGVGSSYNQLYL